MPWIVEGNDVKTIPIDFNDWLRVRSAFTSTSFNMM